MDVRYVLIIGFKLFFAVVQSKYLNACIALRLVLKLMKKELHIFFFCLYNIKPLMKLQCFIL